MSSVLAGGVEFWQQNKETLERAGAEYGVPPEVIVAIIGVETRYGRVTGGHRVVDALTTLGFDYPPRSKFFRKELTQFLLLAREEGKNPLSLTGSYAGLWVSVNLFRRVIVTTPWTLTTTALETFGKIASTPLAASPTISSRHGWQGDAAVAIPVQVQNESPELLGLANESLNQPTP